MFYYQDCMGVGHWLQDDVDMDDPTWREYIEWESNHPLSKYNPVTVRANYKYRNTLDNEYWFEEFEPWLKKNPWFKKYIPEIEVA